jgi:hypothetical protein
MNKTDNTVNAKIILNKKKIHPKGFMFLDFEKRIEFFFPIFIWRRWINGNIYFQFKSILSAKKNHIKCVHKRGIITRKRW